MRFGLVWHGCTVVLWRGASRPATLQKEAHISHMYAFRICRCSPYTKCAPGNMARSSTSLSTYFSPTKRLRAVAPHGPGHPPLAEMDRSMWSWARPCFNSVIKLHWHVQKTRIEQQRVLGAGRGTCPLDQRRHACPTCVISEPILSCNYQSRCPHFRTWIAIRFHEPFSAHPVGHDAVHGTDRSWRLPRQPSSPNTRPADDRLPAATQPASPSSLPAY